MAYFSLGPLGSSNIGWWSCLLYWSLWDCSSSIFPLLTHSISVNKTTTWTDPRIAGPVRSFPLFFFLSCQNKEKTWLTEGTHLSIAVSLDASSEQKQILRLSRAMLSFYTVVNNFIQSRINRPKPIRTRRLAERDDAEVALAWTAIDLSFFSAWKIARLCPIRGTMKRNTVSFVAIYHAHVPTLEIKLNCMSIAKILWKPPFELWWVFAIPKCWKHGNNPPLPSFA